MELFYNIFFLPLEITMRLMLDFNLRLTGSYGISIIWLSIMVNLSLIPIYISAQKFRNQDKFKRELMSEMLDKIKKNYQGRERYFYTQAYYKINKYSPFSSILASLGFLIQIPFFVAAFYLLSEHEVFSGINFLLLEDLSKPDGLFFGLNLLPFIMTVIYFLSGYIQRENFNNSEKYQLWSIGILFLVLLYSQSSALLLYWTFNNLFSLIKSLVEKYFAKNIYVKSNNYSENQNINLDAKSKITSIWSIKFLYDVFVSFMLLFIITFTASKLLPPGINLVFNQKSIYYFIFLSFFTFLILIILNIRNKASLKFFYKKDEKISKFDLTLLLLPIAIVIQYIIFNLNMLTPEDIILFFIKSFILCLVFVLIIPYILCRIADKRLIVSVTTGYIFLFFFMPALALTQNWSGSGSFVIQFLTLLLSIICLFLFYLINKKLLSILVTIFFIFTVSNSFLINKKEVSRNIESSNIEYHSENNHQNILDIISQGSIKKKYDIIYLSYESYPNQETLSYYGFDNSNQISFLKENNFKIYEKNYTIAADTLGSLGRAMNITSSTGKLKLSEYTSGNNFVVKLLSNEGFKSIGIFSNDGYIRGTNPDWDYFFPNEDIEFFNLFGAVTEGEFRFNFRNGSFRYSEYLDKKKEYLKKKENSPYFLLSHNKYPGHTQNSGKCLPNEKKEYFDNMKKANFEMKEDINNILNTNKDSVIIIAGDHGPYLTLNCAAIPKNYDLEKIDRYHLQDRYGAFLAIHWPQDLKKDYNITTLQDIFPAILSNFYNDENIWKLGRISTRTVDEVAGEGLYIEDGLIYGGKNNYETLFIGNKY